MTVKITILLKILENEVVFRVIVFPDSNATRVPSYARWESSDPINQNMFVSVLLKFHESNRRRKDNTVAQKGQKDKQLPTKYYTKLPSVNSGALEG